MRFVLLLILILPLLMQASSIIEVRTKYYQSAVKESAADDFYKEMNSMDVSTNSVLLGYKGMAYMLQAKYSWNPYVKLSSFNTGKDFLEQAIASDSNNIELRFLRFCIQENAPSMLNYGSYISEDKKLILATWKGVKDQDLKLKIKNYFMESNSVTVKERSEL